MCAIARYRTPTYALPNVRTRPATKVVPLSALRLALRQAARDSSIDLDQYTDEEILQGFEDEVNPNDTAGHGRVARFSRTVLDLTMMRPTAESRRLMQNVGEPCLVVRLKAGRRGH